jgi:HEAT repeat protein
MDDLKDRLGGGDRRSTGRADEVAVEAEAHPQLLVGLVVCLSHDDPLVRMRAADALEKATRSHPERLQPFAAAILEIAGVARQQEVRWHAAQLIGRISWTSPQQAQAVRILHEYLNDRSRIVVTFSLQALADLARRDPALKEEIRPLLASMAGSPSPAVRSRAAHLLADLERAKDPRSRRGGQAEANPIMHPEE